MLTDTNAQRPIVTDIVLPVLNEEADLERNIPIIIEYIVRVLSDRFCCRLIIVDNGSTDKTPIVARQLMEKYPQQVSYKRTERRGVGLALRTGWQDSEAQLIGYMDIDLATDLKHLEQTLSILANGEADVVYGSRLHKKSKVIGRSIKRAVISRVFNHIVKHYLQVNISDCMCGFKFLHSKHIKSIIENGATSDGWFFCAELLVVADWYQLHLHQLPVCWTDDPNSKVKIGKLTAEYINAMIKLKKTLTASLRRPMS